MPNISGGLGFGPSPSCLEPAEGKRPRAV